MYRVTFIEGVKDLVFDFPNLATVNAFTDMAFGGYVPKDTMEGKTSLVVEIERIEEDF